MKIIWTRPVSKPSQTAFPREDPNHGALEWIKLINSNALCLPLRSLFWEIYINTPKLYAGC